MSETRIKIDVADLAIGMYVCELDRPWLESPFLFQGFVLDAEENIEEVRQTCEYVYIDPEQSHESVRNDLIALASRQRVASSNSALDQPEKKTGGVGGIDFREHLHLARKIHTRARSYIGGVHKDIRAGDLRVDVKLARSLVTDLADNIMVNPHAMMWLTHLKERSEYTLTHSINVCILALTFGRHVNMERSQLERLGLGALLHDIGKLRVPTEILDKPGKLSPEEYEVMKAHPVEGYKMLQHDEHIPLDSLEIVHHHHERISAKGYPDGLDAGQITALTKMASIVDVYDAITSDRCYHDGMSPYKALQNIYSWTGGQFDKELVEKFMSCMGIYPVGSIVELNNGQIAIVISTTPRTRLRPIILLVMDENRELNNIRRILNLSTQAWEKGLQRIEIKTTHEAGDIGLSVKKILEQESLSPQ